MTFSVLRFHTWLELGDTLTNTFNCSSPFMAQNNREETLGVTTTQSVSISVANPCGKDLKHTRWFKERWWEISRTSEIQ